MYNYDANKTRMFETYLGISSAPNCDVTFVSWWLQVIWTNGVKDCPTLCEIGYNDFEGNYK